MKLQMIWPAVAAAGISLILTAYTYAGKTTKDSSPEVKTSPMDNSKSIYDYTFTTLEGKKVKLSEYKGKKILFVNTASQCGFTYQYAGLQELYTKYKDKMVIIGFPSNQFGEQEPGDNKEIKTFCTKNYGVDFPMSEKIDVKGPKQDPIYHWLTSKDMNGKLDSEVKWNFQKYLIDENGNFVQMYLSKVKPMDADLVSAITK